MCRSCLGAKQLLGVGMMAYETCHNCKGTGTIEFIEDIEMDNFLSTPVVDEAPAAVAIVAEVAVSQKPKYVRPSRAKKK